MILIGKSVDYPCKGSMAVENGTNWKSKASTSASVLCGPQGLLLYPDPWPQCSDTVECEVPTALNIPNDIYTTYENTKVYYKNEIRYFIPNLKKNRLCCNFF